MSEETPERLKEFRTTNARANGASTKRAALYAALLVAGALAGAAFGVFLAKSSERAAPRAAGLTPAQLREYAVYLEQKELPGKAIVAYDAYLDEAELDDATRAKVCYSVGKLAADAGRYTDALAYLYQAELLAPETDALRTEIDKKIVHCLEKLGRTTDLRRELRARTSVKRTADDVGEDEIVLAEFTGEIITDRDLAEEIEKLPAPVRDEMTTPGQRVRLLENMVAERLLLDKAFRQGLESDPEIEHMLSEQRDALIVRKLIANEVESKVVVTPEDVERFYKAEIDRFTEPGTDDAPARVRPFEEVKEEARRMFEAVKRQEQFRGLIEETLKAQDVRLYPDRIEEAKR